MTLPSPFFKHQSSWYAIKTNEYVVSLVLRILFSYYHIFSSKMLKQFKNNKVKYLKKLNSMSALFLLMVHIRVFLVPRSRFCCLLISLMLSIYNISFLRSTKLELCN